MKKTWINAFIILVSLFSYRSALAQFTFQGNTAINFGQLNGMSNEFKEQAFTYRNSSNVTASFSPTITGADPSFFTVNTNQCINIAPGQNCNVIIRFNSSPAMQSRTYVAQMSNVVLSAQVSNSSPASSATTATQAVTPSGSSSQATIPNMFLIEPPNKIFQISNSRASQNTQTFTITNRATIDQNLTFEIIGKDSAYYSITNRSCQSILSRGASCSVSVRINTVPLSVTSQGASLSVSGVEVKMAFQQQP